jgi:hypothetical protein
LATLEEAKKFFVEEAVRCAIFYRGDVYTRKYNADMSECELEFREIKLTLTPADLKVLRTVALTTKNKSKMEPVIWCRLYLPSLSQERAGLFLQWLAKQPV